MQPFSFVQASPVWIAGEDAALNTSVLLRAVVPQDTEAALHIAAHSRCQVFLDGAFFAEGPARAAHGFYCVSVYDLPRAAAPRVLTVLAVGYNVNSFSVWDAPAFVCAELLSGETVLAATGADPGFEAFCDTHRVRKTPRFSFQRPATEAYIYDEAYDLVRKDPSFCPAACTLGKTLPKTFIRRDVPYCDYEERCAKTVLRSGRLVRETDLKRRRNDRMHQPDDGLKGWRKKELEAFPVHEVLAYSPRTKQEGPLPAADALLPAKGFLVYDMGVNTSGFLRLRLNVPEDMTLYAVFSEKVGENGVPEPGADNCQNCVKWTLAGGRDYDLVTFAPYTFRYLALYAPGAGAKIERVSQYTEMYPAAGLKNLKTMPDDDLQTVYDAAVETFRQNATDIFMDCPSRERAGWLCDSFFTARTEYALTGESKVERAFLENFLLPEALPHVPAGMLPMCYPGDHVGGGYIPNWAMWYVLEMEEYEKRSGDRELVDRAKPRLYALRDFFTKYENADGLLQNLESWVFIEWSAANDYVQDVNYPSNMLYARFLEALANLYGDETLRLKSAQIKAAIRRLALRDDGFFADNAVLKNGVPVRTDNHTETAQYYAFFMGVASPETDPALFETMFTAFGPRRKETGAYPDMPASNAFIGNFLRVDLLFRYGRKEQALDEIRAFFLPMAKQTGTLWENMTDFASCCHGFASHVAVWLNAFANGNG